MTRRLRATAVVVGATSERGALYAAGLAGRGYHLFLVDADARALSALADHLSPLDVDVDVHASPLATAEDVDVLSERIRSTLSVSLLVHFAVFERPSRYDNDLKGLADMLWALVTVPSILARVVAARLSFLKRGTIVLVCPTINLRSRLHQQTSTGAAAYAVSFGRTLQAEMGEYGVLVQVVVPQTPPAALWHEPTRIDTVAPDGLHMSPEAFVQSALTGLDRGEEWVFPTLDNLRHWRNHERRRVVLARALANGATAIRYTRGSP